MALCISSTGALFRSHFGVLLLGLFFFFFEVTDVMAAKQPMMAQKRTADRGYVILTVLPVTAPERQNGGWNQQALLLMCSFR